MRQPLLVLLMPALIASGAYGNRCFDRTDLPWTFVDLVRQSEIVLIATASSMTPINPDSDGVANGTIWRKRANLAVERVLRGHFTAPQLSFEVGDCLTIWSLDPGRYVVFVRKDPRLPRRQEYFTRTVPTPDSDFLAALAIVLTIADVPQSEAANAKAALVRRTKDGTLPQGVADELEWMLFG